jgi:hypothetical protein
LLSIGVALLFLVTPSSGEDDIAKFRSVSCFQHSKGGQQLAFGIPNEFIPGQTRQDGGRAFYLNLGVDLRDLSPATTAPDFDANFAKPDWSIQGYGYNPDLDLVSGEVEPPYRHLALAGSLKELTSDLKDFRRFDTCSGCGTDLYLPTQTASVLAIQCYVPHGPPWTGCRVYQEVGDISLRYTIPYVKRQGYEEFATRLQGLLALFERLGRDRCPPPH